MCKLVFFLLHSLAGSILRRVIRSVCISSRVVKLVFVEFAVVCLFLFLLKSSLREIYLSFNILAMAAHYSPGKMRPRQKMDFFVTLSTPSQTQQIWAPKYRRAKFAVLHFKPSLRLWLRSLSLCSLHKVMTCLLTQQMPNTHTHTHTKKDIHSHSLTH